jgi:hypothetical protein
VLNASPSWAPDCSIRSPSVEPDRTAVAATTTSWCALARVNDVAVLLDDRARRADALAEDDPRPLAGPPRSRRPTRSRRRVRLSGRGRAERSADSRSGSPRSCRPSRSAASPSPRPRCRSSRATRSRCGSASRRSCPSPTCPRRTPSWRSGSPAGAAGPPRSSANERGTTAQTASAAARRARRPNVQRSMLTPIVLDAERCSASIAARRAAGNRGRAGSAAARRGFSHRCRQNVSGARTPRRSFLSSRR